MGLPHAKTLLEPVTCFPRWYPIYKSLGGRPESQIVKSGCPTSGGNVQCSPTWMAEAAAQKVGFPISLEAYTLARYMGSEVGSGPAAEKIAVGQAALNRAALEKLPRGILDLLLYRQPAGHPNRGYYGPINVEPKTGRWAATSRDPTRGDIILARELLNGTFDGFNKGADDQDGLEYTKYFPDPAAKVRREAANRKYWVGPLPGVDHWRTFLWRKLKDVPPESPLGQQLIARALVAVSDRGRPDWSQLPVCTGLDARQKVAIAGAVTVAGGAILAAILSRGF